MSEDNTLPAVVGNRSMIPFSPQNLNEALTISKQLASSDLCPKSFGGKPENVLAAIMMGHELGFGVMQSLSNIAVVNGRASVWGEAVSALILNSGVCEYLLDSVEGEGTAMAVTIKTKRKGMPEYSFTYSWADAVKAGLSGKDTYQKNPKDMLYWKGLGRVSKRVYADVMKGLVIREIAEEMATEYVGRVEVEQPAPAAESHKAKKVKATPVPEPEANNEDLLKKSADAKARKDALEAEEKAKAEPKPEPKPAEPAAPQEEDLSDVAEASTVLRAIGTYEKAVKLFDPKTKEPMGFGARLMSGDGMLVFQFKDLEAAMASKEHAGKTVEILHEPIAPALVGIVGRIVKLSTFSK